MDTPTHYSDLCEKALTVKEKYSLTDVQTLLYNHICRGDFYFCNNEGQKFYDKKNEGFGWGGNRTWVKKQLNPLVKAGLVAFKSLHNCRDGKYTTWNWWCPEFNFDSLVDAGCYVTTHKIALIKHYLGLPDGFDKCNRVYGDLELIYKNGNYTFKFKGKENIYAWDIYGQGIKEDLSWLDGKPTYDKPIVYREFSDMVHNIWSFLAFNKHKYLVNVPGYCTERRFSL